MSPPVHEPAAARAPLAAGGTQAHWQTIGNDGTQSYGSYRAQAPGQPGCKISKPPEMTGRKAMGPTAEKLWQPGRRILCIRTNLQRKEELIA